MMNSASNPPPGWYRDPAGGDGERFWDGVAWSQSTRDAPPAPTEEPPTASHGAFAPYGGQASTYHAVSAPNPYAGFGWRLLGYLLDTLLLSILANYIAAATPIPGMTGRAMQRWERAIALWSEAPHNAMPMPDAEFWIAILWSTLLVTTVQGIYRTLLLRFLNATLGQRVLGLRVVRDGDDPSAPLDWGTAMTRGLGGAVLWQVLGFINGIFAAFTNKRQALSDMVSKTVVYKVR